MKRILITGAEGFTGRYLATALTQAGYEVHGLVRLPQPPIDGVAHLHACDLLDAPGLADLMQRVQPHRVAHLAGISFVAHGDANAIYSINLMGSRNLLEAMVSAGAPLEAVLMASSSNVYGNATGGTLEETTPPAPANDYAVSKLAMEYMARLYTPRVPLIIARPFNYTGVGQAPSFLLPKIVSHVQRKAPVIELGNLEVARDFSDVRTVVAYYQRLLETPAAIGGTFNVCSGQAHTLADVLAMARELSGHEFEVRVNPAFVRQNEVRILLGSRARLDATVGAVPAIPLRDTLRWMLEAPH